MSKLAEPDSVLYITGQPLMYRYGNKMRPVLAKTKCSNSLNYHKVDVGCPKERNIETELTNRIQQNWPFCGM